MFIVYLQPFNVYVFLHTLHMVKYLSSLDGLYVCYSHLNKMSDFV